MLQQQQQALYYDRLLHHLNRTFLMNMKAQELFLDMSRHTKTIRFKSIKNIYNTLTEGKADEVIYQKDKQQLIDQHVFNQKFTQRTCWRVIQKLITKVSYYLSNEKALGAIAPSVLKVISFLKTANEKVNNRASFVEFFEEVLDCVVAQNNLLQEKIYDLLIRRGYIYSIDEFYRLNRFEGPHADYVCPDQPQPEEGKEEEYSLEVAGKSIDTSSVAMSKKSRSRFGVFSSKRSALHNRSRTNMQDSHIPQEENGQQQSQQQQGVSSSQEVRAEEYNRLSHNIHQQVEKTVDELLNNHHFSSFIQSNHSEEHVSSMHDSNAKSVKPSLVRQLLKNLKNRNFKANQKILIISSGMENGKEEERKNSSQTLLKKNHKSVASLQKNRTSIAMALSKGMKERIFKNEHLADIEDLIINNLDRLEGARGRDADSPSNNGGFHRGPIKRNIFFRSKPRQHTQILPKHNQETIAKSTRRASNFQFPNSNFAFQGKLLPRFNDPRRVSNFGPECRMSQISSNMTIQSPSCQDKLEFIERYVNKAGKNNGKGSNRGHNNQRGHKSYISNATNASRFGGEIKQIPPKQNRFFCHNHPKGKTEEFNPTLLKITAQKYNKCVTEQPEAIRTLQLRDLNILEGVEELGCGMSSSTLDYPGRERRKGSEASEAREAREAREYQHGRPYEVYDRKLRRIL